MPIEGAQVERTNLLARRTREAEPREASRNRRANGRVEPQRAPPSLGAFQMATIFRASASALRSASMRSASAVARAAARSRSCARRFGAHAVKALRDQSSLQRPGEPAGASRGWQRPVSTPRASPQR